ncbi:hypothetical protein TPE_1289 [Treponema pedis str. T A4]|uniref:Uncharacterized protein n=1 Tax=Treponema pedis str. T A4 TaxID=1291379 RepID=S6A8G4_9SPIR|nr:hypothetical protein TPE_1289 [Treponema pedis str. T A4]
MFKETACRFLSKLSSAPSKTPVMLILVLISGVFKVPPSSTINEHSSVYSCIMATRSVRVTVVPRLTMRSMMSSSVNTWLSVT